MDASDLVAGARSSGGAPYAESIVEADAWITHFNSGPNTHEGAGSGSGVSPLSGSNAVRGICGSLHSVCPNLDDLWLYGKTEEGTRQRITIQQMQKELALWKQSLIWQELDSLVVKTKHNRVTGSMFIQYYLE
jgi:hypothetical protein